VAIPEEGALRQGALDLGVALDAGAIERLGRFIELLTTWNRRIRLTGDRNPRILVRKHVVDSLAVVPELPSSGLVIDVGSGGGFPGIVLGCARPDLALRLIEPRRRPTSFLSEAIRAIPLPEAKALEMRAEDATADPSLARHAQVIVSRALRLDVLLAVGIPLLATGGVIVAMQTPSSTARDVRDPAGEVGVELLRSREYRLPDGEARRLLIFAKS
jgi:16S rRNA (guanine527-N7)-methyltransferase